MNNTHEEEQCQYQYCCEAATGEDRRNIPVCQYHAEQDWAKD